MPDGKLFIGSKRYSSWSMRGWLAVQLAGLKVEEVMIPLEATPSAAILAATPIGLVPYLEHRGARIWESLAICEYCAEQAQGGGSAEPAQGGGSAGQAPGLWPEDRALRALARSAAAEMHAGFRGLRQAMPMNLGREFPGKGATPEALADIARIEALWREVRGASGGPFLHGAQFGLVDAMFGPVVARFLTWQPALAADTQAYVAAARAHPLLQRWYAEALAEPAAWLLDKYENPPGAA